MAQRAPARMMRAFYRRFVASQNVSDDARAGDPQNHLRFPWKTTSAGKRARRNLEGAGVRDGVARPIGCLSLLEFLQESDKKLPSAVGV